MADEEEYEEQETEEQEQEQEQEQEAVEEVREEKKKPRPPPKRDEDEGGEKELSEAEKAMLAAKKRHEAEEQSRLAEYEAQRQIEREKEEEELRALKEKLERRKQEREEEEEIMAEQRRLAEERFRQDEEKKKQKQEEAKRKREEEKKKRAALMGGNAPTVGSGKNFVVNKSGKSSASTEANLSGTKEAVPTQEQEDEAKKSFMEGILRGLSYEGMGASDLKDRIKQMHARICKLEAAKYDLEKRQERQEYDLKELHERQRQAARNKAVKKGLDPDSAANSPFPPKVNMTSKHDRQIDRRSYGDRRNLYENPARKPKPKVFHGSARPPSGWGRMKNCAAEELEAILKSGMVNSPKYVELVKDENAKPPMNPIPAQPLPEEDMQEAVSPPAAAAAVEEEEEEEE